MLYRLKNNCFFRIYKLNNEVLGYLKNEFTSDDICLEGSAVIFLSRLTKEAKDEKKIINEITECFSETSPDIIKKDMEEFFFNLEKLGYVISGNSEEELNSKNHFFSYNEQRKDTSYISGTPLAKRSGWSVLMEKLGTHVQLLEMEIEITNKCNERCIHCYIPTKERSSQIDTYINPALFYSFLKQARDMNMICIDITGGECMLHPNFIDFIKKCEEYDFSITIFSNLTMLTDSIIDVLKTPYINAVRVSLYSIEPKIHDLITTVKGSCEKTKKNIGKLIANNIPVEINCPIIRANKDSFEDVIKWGETRNVRVNADYQIFASYGENKNNLASRLNFDELEVAMQKLLDKDADYLAAKEGIYYSEKKNRFMDFCCGACTYTYCMNSKGFIYPCTGWQNYELGNINNTSLKDIIFKSNKANYIRQLRRVDFKKCLTCEDIDYCRFCLMKNALEDPNQDMKNLNPYFCSMAKLKHKLVNQKLNTKIIK